MDRSLLYVSRQSLAISDRDRIIDRIVAQSRLRNADLGVSGALCCTANHFAQLLEGPSERLDELMHRIERDYRHTDVTILRVEAITRRRLPGWLMAYSGMSTYVARQIAPLIGVAAEANPARIDRLDRLLVGLAVQ